MDKRIPWVLKNEILWIIYVMARVLWEDLPPEVFSLKHYLSGVLRGYVKIIGIGGCLRFWELFFKNVVN